MPLYPPFSNPPTDDGLALGTTALKWSDLFLASGSVIDFNSGDITVTHSANLLTFAGATSGYSFDSLITAAGGQIAFPATQNASAGANTLDDYEEGTWTPVLTFATAGDLSVAYSAARIGTYTKIGRLVTIAYVVDTTTFTHTTASGALLVTGLPFTSANVGFQTVYNCGGFEGITKANYTQFTARVAANTAQIDWYAHASAQNASQVVVADVPSGGTPLVDGTLPYVT